jgi:hypothetical protein
VGCQRSVKRQLATDIHRLLQHRAGVEKHQFRQNKSLGLVANIFVLQFAQPLSDSQMFPFSARIGSSTDLVIRDVAVRRFDAEESRYPAHL